MFLWNMGNTILFGRMIITSATSTWYFSREKSILEVIASFFLLVLIILKLPVLRGLKYTARFHIGTIAYGSIVIALNWPFKSFFGMIKNRLKKIRNRKSRSFRFWMASCNIALSFYEYVLKYVSNKNVMQVILFL